ncbi:MAG: transporter substrate-binding domain-containing protein [Cyanobacteria bacterium P01_D01_bin.44]
MKRLGIGIALCLGMAGAVALGQSVSLLAQEIDLPANPKSVVKVGTNEIQPFVFLPKSDGGSVEELPYGYTIDLWQTIADELDVKTEWVRYDSVGQTLDALLAGEIDVAAAGISITSAREAYGIDFSYPFYQAGLQLMVTVDKPNFLQKLGRRLFAWSTLRPILLVVISSAVFGSLIWLVERKHNAAFSGSPISGVGQGIWFALVTLGTFGYGDITPIKFTGRLLACVWMGVSFFIVGDFIASMTVVQLAESDQSLSDFQGQPIGVVQRTTAATFLRSHPVRMVEYPDFDAAVAALESGEVVGVLRDYPTLRYLVNLNPDKFELIGERLTQEDYGIAVAEDRQDELLENINREILSLQEQGYLQDRINQWFGSNLHEEIE